MNDLENDPWVVLFSEVTKLYSWHVEPLEAFQRKGPGVNEWKIVAYCNNSKDAWSRFNYLFDEWKNRTKPVNPQKERSKMTQSLRYEILKRDGYKCIVCGRTVYDGIKLHVDHIHPISKGGRTTRDNLRTLCNECNSGKAARDA